MNGAMVRSVETIKVRGSGAATTEDVVAVEEPLEIRIAAGVEPERSVSITMRTPGNDEELAIGFLWGEGVISDSSQIDRPLPAVRGDQNVAAISLTGIVAADLARLERNSYTTSSCGVCGKTSIALLRQRSRFELPDGAPLVDASVLHDLPRRVRERQGVFSQTGGLHGAALVSSDGTIIALREDVGRHNAVDKLIGAQVLLDNLPLSEQLLFLSGRASFELVQKASMAGIPIVAAVGAPSSLAIELAESTGITLIGFLRDERFNVYSHPRRLATPPASRG